MKDRITITIRPALVQKVDRLATKVGLSRSETICRLAGLFVDDLLDPKVGWIQISRDSLQDILEL